MSLAWSVFHPMSRRSPIFAAALCAWLLACVAPVSAQTRRVTFPPAESPPPPAVKKVNKEQSNSEMTHIDDGHGPDQSKTQQRKPPPPTNLTVIHKLQYGATLEYVHANGMVQRFEQWKSYPVDAQALTTNVNRRLADGNNYQYMTKPLASSGFDPIDVPMLYMAGDYDFVLNEAEVLHLRKFLTSGGTILFNAARGRDEFNRAVMREMRKVMPTKRFAPLSLDHPVFNARYRVRNVIAQIEGVQVSQAPEVMSIDIGSRAAAILVPMGMGAAWSKDSYHPNGRHLVGESAIRLGVNITAYVLGSTEYGKFLAQEFPVYSGKTGPGDVLRFAQIRYGGSWDDNPAVQNTLLSVFHQMTGVEVDYAPVTLTLDDPNIGNYPLVFMTGHHDFQLSKEEAAGLVEYLNRGGMVIASASAGLKPFDTAFRRELKKAAKEADLIRIPPSHAIFASGWNSVEKITYTQAAQRENPSLDTPEFWGLFIDNRLSVIYTPYDLLGGVNRECNAYSKGIMPDDAERVAVNLITYALSH